METRVVTKGLIAALLAGTVAVAGVAVAPAIGASNPAPRAAFAHDVQISDLGTFTPAAADPRLAALLAKSGLGEDGFRFTAPDARRNHNRALTVSVRARSNQAALAADKSSAAPAAVSLTPIAYNLGVAVGWKRFAVSTDVAKIDFGSQPGSRESADVGLSYTGQRVSGRVKASADRPLGNTPALVNENPGYSVDVGGSYALTRRLDVTAGVRYRTERDQRLLPLEDTGRRDSQGVYLGTAFRF